MTSPPMTQLVLTIIGPDRPGLVDALAREVKEHSGNWLESRMACLASHFAGIVLVEVPGAQVDALCAKLSGLKQMSVQVTVAGGEGRTEPAAPRRATLELTGIDHPGIVQSVTEALAARGVNIEELDTDVTRAPMSGEPTFNARARLQVPADVRLADLADALEELGSHLMVDIDIEELVTPPA